MKIDAKVVMWGGVVPFAVAVFLASFGTSNQKVQVGYGLGQMTPNEMSLVIGGGEGGCSLNTENCEGDGESPNKACVSGKASSDEIILKEYHGGTYDTPYGTNNPTSKLSPKEDSTPTCYDSYTCKAGGYQSFAACYIDELPHSAGCNLPTSMDNIPGCTPLSCSNNGPSKISQGRCVDP